VPHTVRGPAPQAPRRAVTGGAPLASHARRFHGDPTVGRRLEQAGARVVAPRVHPDGNRPHFTTAKKSSTPIRVVREKLENNLLHISAALFFVGALGWCWLIVNQFRSPSPSLGSAYEMTTKTDTGVAKANSLAASTYVRNNYYYPVTAAAADRSLDGGETAAGVVAREWNRFEAVQLAERGRSAAAKQAVNAAAKPAATKPQIRLASLESPEPQIAPSRAPLANRPSRMPPNVGAETSLVAFQSAPFPYRGTIPGSGRPFLNVNKDGRLGHTNFRGHVFWEADTFSDDRVLLHIPPGFDPTQPAVMVVFFHGHGADLARDVRDRQQVPEQITAAGANAVLVAPQFAFDAADSSAGKFWEPNGFKRFLDEAAIKLARLYGDPRAAAAFAKMPIVIVAYSGGFGPTLSILERGGVRPRVRGIVLLDALYAGIDKFADWIADNRSTFFVSSYTARTAYHNAALEQLLRARSVPYGSELRRSQLQGMVAFLPTGNISHRDFVTHAWCDGPIRDIIARLEDIEPKDTVATTSQVSGYAPAKRN
jgi:hypothetical protein